MNNKIKTVHEKSSRLMDEYFKNVTDEEFIKTYLECENFGGPTIDEFISWMPINQNKNSGLA